VRKALQLVFVLSNSVAAGTFIGESQVNYVVHEYVDGILTVVEQPGPLTFVLTSDNPKCTFWRAAAAAISFVRSLNHSQQDLRELLE
jgi:hypothetical protein